LALNRPRLIAIGLLVVALLVGMAAGVALDRCVLRPVPWAEGPGRWAGGPGLGGPEAGRIRQLFLRRLADDLDLSPEQRPRVDSLLTAQQDRIRAVMQQVRPEMMAIADSTHAVLKTILTPDQWQRFLRTQPGRFDRRPWPPAGHP
jgi:Spy/CpxP family protein refolding chaperone